MALKKDITTKHGFIANYWRINSVITDKNDKEGSCIISVYKDRDTAMIASESIESKYVNLFIGVPTDVSDFERKMIVEDRYEKYFGKQTEYKDIYEACYEMCKDVEPFFKDAEDC